MTTRSQIVAQAQSWIGCKESDGSHKKIIDCYNSHKPLARGYKLKYTDAWCSGFVSACAIACGATDIIPTEVGCGEHIKLFKQKGIWVESDAHVPSPGDIIFYDWQDSGKGDNTGGSDHVGIVEKVSNGTITVIEGNISNSVGRRNIPVNGRYIRGYGVPKYAAHTEAHENTPKNDELFVGDIVAFTGGRHYIDPYSDRGYAVSGGRAKITAIDQKGKHPYHLRAVDSKGDFTYGVYGWVDRGTVKPALTAGDLKVGDIVSFKGSVHYTSSFLEARGVKTVPSRAVVTAVYPKNVHPVHLRAVDDNGKYINGVYGWVNLGDIELK